VARTIKATLSSIAARDIAGRRAQLKRLTADRVRRTMARILNRTPLCAIATVTADGRAHINTAYFACSDTLELYFLSHPSSQHCRNLRTRPVAAIAVFESGQTWGELDRGLQLFGSCREADGAASRTAERIYARRFKPYSSWKAELESETAGEDYRFYRFVTRQAKLFDEREFGGAVFVTATIVRPR
jgi:uncharacterized protein YhbP (UPF0306 family)